jgi:hypothetical protein
MNYLFGQGMRNMGSTQSSLANYLRQRLLSMGKESGGCIIKSEYVIWMAIENMILIWDNRMKRGSPGPNRCSLCKGNLESVQHLFISCHYSL